MSTAGPPEDLDLDNLDQYSEAEIEAYNEAKREELSASLDDHVADLDAEKQRGVEELAQAAEETRDTVTREFPSGLEIEVYERVTPAAERHHNRLQHLERRDDTPREETIRANCKALAAMCATERFSDPDVWVAATRRSGAQWLGEMTAEILEPAVERAEQTGNRLKR